MRKSLAVFLLTLGFSSWLLGVDFVKDGKSQCVILPTDNIVEKFAAEEFAAFARKITGAEVAIAREPVAGKTGIRFILITDDNAGQIARANELKYDGYMIVANAREVVIASRRRRGFLYGVYHILKNAGMVWLYPGDDGEICPKSPNLSIADGTIVKNPDFSDRHFRLNGAGGRVPKTYDWLVRNGMQVFGGEKKYDPVYFFGGHILTRLLVGSNKKADAEKLLAEKPELFGMRNGKRVIGSIEYIKGVDYSQPCTSNPETVRRMIENAKIMIDGIKDYSDVIFSLCNDDHPNWCECENCTKMDPPDEVNNPLGRQYSTRFWTFVNQMSAALPRDKYPHLTLNALSYMNFITVPTGVKPDPRVRVTLCGMYRCYFHSMDDERCPYNQERYRQAFDAWGKSGMRATNFEYHTDIPGPSRYFPAERAWVRDMKYRHSLNMCGAGIVTRPPDGNFKPPWNDYRAYNMWYSLWQLHWMAAHFFWNINDDYEKVWEDINSKFYGRAWPEMRKYRLLMEKSLEDSDAIVKWGGDPRVYGHAYDRPGVAKKLRNYIDAALDSVDSKSVYYKRLIRENEYFEKNWVAASSNGIGSPNRAWAFKRTKNILVDGNDKDADWVTAPCMTGFLVLRSDGKAASPQTSVRLLYDKDALYFLIEAELDKSCTVKTNAQQNGRAIFNDSHIEIFLGNNKMRSKYYMLAFSWNGKRYQAFAEDSSGNNNYNIDTEAEIVIRRSPEMLTAEVRLPIAKLGAFDEDTRWRVNVARAEHMVADSQLSSICNGNFHGAALHRSLVLDGITESTLILNGSFEDLDEPVLANDPKVDWVYNGKEAPVSWTFSKVNRGTLTCCKGGAADGKRYIRVKGSYPFIQQKLTKLGPFQGEVTMKAKTRGKGELYLRLVDGKGARIGENIQKVNSTEWISYSDKIYVENPREVLIRTHGEIDLDDVKVSIVARDGLNHSSLILKSKKESAVYKEGEDVMFYADVTNFETQRKGKYEMEFILKGEGGINKTFKVPYLGVPLEIPGELKAPGFVLLKARLLRNGKPLVKDYLLAGAGMRVSEIKQGSKEPADFDEFWKTQLAKMRERKTKVIEKELPLPQNSKLNVSVYDVRIEDGVLNTTGVLSMPKGAKPKSLSAIATFAGASWIGTRPNYYLAESANSLVFCMNLHDTGNILTEKEKYELRKTIGGYQFRNPDDPEKYPMRDIFLRVVRTLDYLKSRPEWNGRILIASGGSLGGAQAIVAAALDPQVVFCNSQVPAMCDHDGASSGQTPGWPNILAGIQDPALREKARKNMGYFDVVNFAKRVKCETIMCTGFIDDTCPPVTNYAAFNALGSAKKTMTNVTLAGHGASRKPGEPNVFSHGMGRVTRFALDKK